MTKLLLSILILLLCMGDVAIAQKIRYADTANRWKMAWYGEDGPISTRIEQYLGDTIVNGLHYSKSKQTQNIYWVRDDTVANLVYYTPGFDSVDRVLYDYNLKVGDTFTSCEYQFRYCFDPIKFIVTAIDTIEMLSHKYVVQTFNQSGSFFDVTVIEGIGAINGKLNLQPLHVNPENDLIVCFERGGIRPILNKKVEWFDNMSSCAVVSVKNLVANKHIVKIIPHPATAASKMILTENTLPAQLRITNMLGQVIVKETITTPEHRLNIHTQYPGTYVYRVTGRSGEVYMGKFLVE